MRALVLGANGLLGSQALLRAVDLDWSVAGAIHTETPEFETHLYRLDIRDSDRF